MWPKLKKFFTDEATFDSLWDKWVTRVRLLLMSAGAAVAVPGPIQDFVQKLIPPKYAPYAGVLTMGFSVLFRAGDRTPANIRALSQEMRPTQGGAQ